MSATGESEARGVGRVGCPSRSPPGVSDPRPAFRLPRSAHEHATAHAHATREPRPSLAAAPSFSTDSGYAFSRLVLQ